MVDVAASSLGTACSSGANCASGICVEGVCCDDSCSGQCQSCKLVGKIGTCSAVVSAPPTSKQPCPGSGACAGKCDGVSAGCVMPNAETVCAAASCSGGTATPSRSCNGAGACRSVDSFSCGNYACGATSCRTSCSGMEDCAPGAVCSGASCLSCSAGKSICSNQCVDLKTDSAHCGSCTKACGAGERCKDGACLLADGQRCTGDAQCAAGRCVSFYVDNDGDGYPDRSNQQSWCGVTSSLLPGFIAPRSDDRWDCCDSESLIHPDQNLYFATSTSACGVGFDYDCSGAVEKAPMPGSGSCHFDDTGTCGSAAGAPSENCGSMHFSQGCQSIEASPPLCVSTTSMAAGTVTCH